MQLVRVRRGAQRCRAWSPAALLAMVVWCAPVMAHEIAIDSYLPGFSLKADGDVQYTLGVRTEAPDATIYRNPVYTESDLQYGGDSLNVARVDLGGSFDVGYQDWAGFRFSAVSWMDNAFNSSLKTPPDGTPTLTAPNYVALFDFTPPAPTTSFPVDYAKIQDYKNGEYNDYAKRWEGGPSAEIRDLFFWGDFALWHVPFNVKLGQYSNYWGESLFDSVNGISYAQMPVDLDRGLREPGSELRDLALPLPQIGITAQPTPAFSFGLQYLLGWGASRLPPAGTYFGTPYPIQGDDGQIFSGMTLPIDGKGDSVPMMIPYQGYVKPHNGGSFGLYLKYRPEWLWGVSTGLYYRRADETLPWVLEHSVKAIQSRPFLICFNEKVDPFPLCSALTASQALIGYNDVYNHGVQLLGLSLEKNWHGMTFGSEIVMRHGTALQTLLAPAPSMAAYGPDTVPNAPPAGLVEGQGARGDTTHALLNVTGSVHPTRFWAAIDWKAELGYVHLGSIKQNSFIYAGEGYGGCTLGPLAGNPAGFRSALGADTPGSKADGCASSSALDAHVSFTPTWNDVRPGLNLSLPISIEDGLMGNSPVLGGSQAGSGDYSLGLGAEYRRRYNFGLAYNNYLSRYHTDSNGVVTGSAVNPLGSGVYNDRGWVSMTFRMKF